MNVQRVLCVTATATPAVQSDICDTFNIVDDDKICTPFFRPNLHLRSQVVTTESRDQILIEKLKSSQRGATIIYVTLQKTAETVAQKINAAGLPAKAYHAGMSPDVRSEIQEWFMNDEHGIVVATIAFGMGIDKSNIRYVYHYNPPKSLESYSQEIGRAGRDGEISRCELLFVPDDRITLENFVFGDTPAQPSIEAFIAEIASREDEFFVSPIKLGNLCDIRSIVTKTLLTYLELDGYLESTALDTRVILLSRISPATSCSRISKANASSLCEGYWPAAKKRRTWFSIDINEVIKNLTPIVLES